MGLNPTPAVAPSWLFGRHGGRVVKTQNKKGLIAGLSEGSLQCGSALVLLLINNLNNK